MVGSEDIRQASETVIHMRPKKRSRARSPREKLLDAGTQLFCRYGINAIGVDAIVTKAGTAKATLYNIFGSKEALAYEVLNREGERWRAWLFEELDAFDAEPADKLLHIFDILEDWFRGKRYYGCPFINAVAEHDKLDDRLRNIALGHKKIVLDRIRELAAASGASDPEETAHELAVMIDGTIVAALITRQPETASLAKRAAAVILDSHIRTRSPAQPACA